MIDVVISFHSSMFQVDWRGKQLINLFGPNTVFIEGGSGLQSMPGGYSGAIMKSQKSVPRSPSDPKYVASKEATHFRQALLRPYIMQHTPIDKNKQPRPIGANEPVRVCVIGYSEGCQGVNVFLKSTDIGYIDTAVAIDGIHWGKDSWRNPNDNKIYDCRDGSACMIESSKPWLRFASLAAFGKSPDNPTISPGSRCLVLTASDTAGPPCCRQSKWALNYIKEKVLAGHTGPTADPPAGIMNLTHSPPYGFPPWKDGPAVQYAKSPAREYITWGNFWEFYYDNIDVGGSGHWDHVYQSKVVLPLMLEKIVIPRWNASTGGTLVGV